MCRKKKSGRSKRKSRAARDKFRANNDQSSVGFFFRSARQSTSTTAKRFKSSGDVTNETAIQADGRHVKSKVNLNFPPNSNRSGKFEFENGKSGGRIESVQPAVCPADVYTHRHTRGGGGNYLHIKRVIIFLLCCTVSPTERDTHRF